MAPVCFSCAKDSPVEADKPHGQAELSHLQMGVGEVLVKVSEVCNEPALVSLERKPGYRSGISGIPAYQVSIRSYVKTD